MGRLKTVEGIEKNPLMSIYCPTTMKAQEQQVAEKKGMNLSERIRWLMKRDIQENLGSDMPISFDYEEKVKEKTKALLNEKKQQSLLEGVPLENSQGNVFDAIWDFITNAFDFKLENGATNLKTIQSIRQKLALYDCDGTEQFNNSHKLMFIHYLDFMILRKSLESELDTFLKENAANFPLISDSS